MVEWRKPLVGAVIAARGLVQKRLVRASLVLGDDDERRMNAETMRHCVRTRRFTAVPGVQRTKPEGGFQCGMVSYRIDTALDQSKDESTSGKCASTEPRTLPSARWPLSMSHTAIWRGYQRAGTPARPRLARAALSLHLTAWRMRSSHHFEFSAESDFTRNAST